jgi:hypothetical protein
MRFALLSLLLIASSATYAQVQRTAQVPGRFQLFQGEYQFINLKGEAHWHRALFKLDTATGEIFICEGRQIDGRHLKSPQPGKMIQRQNCQPFEEEIVAPIE